MIRIFNLFCKLKEIKISDQEWFGQAFRRLSLSEQSCPYCNSKGNLIPHDSYSRYMVSLKDNSPVTVILRVPRVKCTSFDLSLTVLPFMLPLMPLPVWMAERKISVYLITSTVCLILLLLTCAVTAGETWFPVAEAGVIFGLSFFILPVLLKQLPLPEWMRGEEA